MNAPTIEKRMFCTSTEDMAMIRRIAERAVTIAGTLSIEYDLKTALLDIEACHCNGTPLRLAELERANDFDFGHDVFGIRRHINRTTGAMGDCFLPRLAV